MKKILVLLGPNLNMVGVREKGVYGTETADSIAAQIKDCALKASFEAEIFQSNHEGELIDRIHASREEFSGAVINAGALTHYSYALHDALASVDKIRKIEVHLSDITKREGFRAQSVTKAACQAQIYGKGFAGYAEALDRMAELLGLRKG